MTRGSSEDSQMQRSTHSTPFTALWLILAAALCVVIAMWGGRISVALGPGIDHLAAVPVPRATAAPNIVTDYTDDGTATTDSLCDELAPRASIVTVETSTGVILSTLQCPVGTEPAKGCLYGQSSDGMLVVLSAKTGSVLTRAQAGNCSN
jgi:hypothetical protein